MEFEHLCMGCMAEKGEATTCPYCRWDGKKTSSSPLSLPSRIVLGKRFIIGRVVHQTALHTTYIAFDQKTSKKLVVKEYLPRYLSIERDQNYHISVAEEAEKAVFAEGLKLFLREGTALQKLATQAGMAKVFGVATANGTAYQPIEHIAGENFEQFVDSNGGQISYNLATKIMLPVMAALETAHEQGICHYDIHPGNIMVTREFLGCLVNFNAAGFAVIKNNKDLREQIIPNYAAPELFTSSGAPGAWSDIYSIAALMYRALTGSKPPGSLTRLRKDTLKPPSHLGKNLWIDAEKSLIRALSLSASTRFRNMGEFQRSLIESVPQQERARSSQAIDAFAAVNCPYCGIMNEILVTDLQSGASTCFACDHSLQIEADLTPAIAPAGDKPFQFNVDFDRLIESVEEDVLRTEKPDEVPSPLAEADISVPVEENEKMDTLLEQLDHSSIEVDEAPEIGVSTPPIQLEARPSIPEKQVESDTDTAEATAPPAQREPRPGPHQDQAEEIVEQTEVITETQATPVPITPGEQGVNLPAAIGAEPLAVRDEPVNQKDQPAAGMMLTKILCPSCQIENELPPVQILSGAVCKNCNSPFISATPRPRTKPGPTAPTRGQPEVPARSRMPIYVGIAAILVLLTGAFFAFQYYTAQNTAPPEVTTPDYLGEAESLFSRGNFAEALSRYQHALLAAPDDDYILGRISACQAEINRIAEDNKAPTEYELLVAEADSLLTRKKFADAKPVYETALRHKPGDEYVLNQLATVNKRLAKSTSKSVSPKPRKISLPSGSDLYTSVQSLKPNATLQLASGIFFLSQPLVIRRELRINGAGLKQTLVSYQGSGDAITVAKGGNLIVNGVGFEYSGKGGANLLTITEGTVNVRNSSFASAKPGSAYDKGGAGIHFTGNARGTVQATKFTGNSAGIKVSGRSSPTIRNNDLFFNENGLVITDNARPKIIDNQIRDNSGDGIWLTGSPQPIVELNKISDNKKNGVLLNTRQYSGEFRKNEVIGNKHHGMLISGESQPVLEDNMVKSNSLGGLKYKDAASGISRNNQIVSNRSWGIQVANLAKPSVEGNTIKSNQGDGIEVLDKAKPRIIKNEILQNNGDGINLILSQSGGFIRNNVCSGNQGYGISILSDAQPEMSSNATGGNSEGDIYNEYESKISP